MKSKLYYESHITIDPVLDEYDLNRLKKLVKPFGFRVAKLVMLKGADHKKDSFMTARRTDWHAIYQNTKWAVNQLRIEGFNVRRYKIEDTLLDSNIEDEMKVL